MTNYTQYAGAETNRGPSGAIWGDCPWGAITDQVGQGNGGVAYFDDFLNFSDHISDQSTQQYDSYIDTGVTMIQQAGDGGMGFGAADARGAIEWAGNDADNDEGVISTHGPLVQLSDAAGELKKTWFEARWKKASIANNALAAFVGLAFDHGSSVPVALTLCLTDDDGDLGAFSYLGFHVDQADGDAMDAVYKAEGQAQTVNVAGIQTMVADTYYKTGFVFDPDAPDDKWITWYVDGSPSGTYVTKTNFEAATFPDAEPLGLVACFKTGAAAEVKAQLDWWRVAQIG